MPFGRKHVRHYRIAVVEGKEKLTSDPNMVLGTYEVIGKKLNIDRDLLNNWLKKGAQPTDSIRKLLGL